MKFKEKNLNKVSMGMVDLSDWEFRTSCSSKQDTRQGSQSPNKPLKFKLATELVRYLVEADYQSISPIQSQIDCRLSADADFKAWCEKAPAIEGLEHFPKYREVNHDCYHDACRAVMEEKATGIQRDLCQGLETEILESSLIIPKGQTLFHGRSNDEVGCLKPYPSVISTTLDAVVAMERAIGRVRDKKQKGKQATIYILTLGCCLPALLAHDDSLEEFELLLQTKLCTKVQSQCEVKCGRESVGLLHVFEATVYRSF